MTLLAVATAGAVGSMLRWLISLRVKWPAGTLAVNLLGSLALGLLLGVASTRTLDPLVVDSVGSGLLGGFTTFSAFTVDAVRLDRVSAAGYIVATVAGSLALAMAGWAVVT